jgi:membrane-associated PAP2 superfamily phosphatase/4-amino-4-deoxy-L-arabinose transferase-like glycosyltransferase
MRTIAAVLRRARPRFSASLAIAVAMVATVSVPLVAFPEIDLSVSRAFYTGGGEFAGQAVPWVNGLRNFFIAFYWICVGLAVVGLWRTRAKSGSWLCLTSAKWLFVAICLCAGPGFNLLLKDHWGRPRPKQIVEFGGHRQFAPAIVPARNCERSCSFVSGEAATSFLPFLAGSALFPRYAILLVVAGTLSGITAGLVRVSQGAHFLSDIVFAGFFMAAVVFIAYHFTLRRPAPSPHPSTVSHWWFSGERGARLSGIVKSQWVRVAPLIAILAYAMILTVFAVFALGAKPLHHDMTEAWAWGKEFQLGYAKHPPFFAWLAGGWFLLMPRTDWAFYLLSSLNISIALVGVWMLAGRYLARNGQIAAIMFLVLTPSFSLWSLKFNANAPLLSLWPWTAYMLLRSLETRRASFSIAAGFLGAAALLTKYYSLLFCVALLAAALLHSERRRYFTSTAPYLTLATVCLCLLPHAWWAMSAGFPTIEYAISKTYFTPSEARATTIRSIAGNIAAIVPALAVFAFAFGAQWLPLVKRTFSRSGCMRRGELLCLTFIPLALTIAAYVFVNARISSGFLIPDFFCLPIAILALSQAQVTTDVVRRLGRAVATSWMALLLASPFLGYLDFAKPDGAGNEPRRELAAAATHLWRETFATPLRNVAGDAPLATAVTFYSPDAPSYLAMGRPQDTPWVTTDQLERDGLLVVCPAEMGYCLDTAATLAGSHAVRVTYTLASTYLDHTAPGHAYVIILAPPVHAHARQSGGSTPAAQ